MLSKENPFSGYKSESEVAEEEEPPIYTIPERYLLAWRCRCGRWHTSKHSLDRIKRNIELGSLACPLRTKAVKCSECDSKEHRLNSKYSSSVFAAVSTRKVKQMQNLKACVEALNQHRDDDEPHDVRVLNSLWFETARHTCRPQGRGQRFWCQPIRRWRKLLEGE